MIDTEQYDRRLKQDIPIAEFWDFERVVRDNERNHKAELNTRDRLFFDFRYQTGSYKARKAGISRPSVMMRFGKDKFRLYGNAENNKLFGQAKVILASWKARNKAEMRTLKTEYKAWLKAHRVSARDNPFWYWNLHIKVSGVK